MEATIVQSNYRFNLVNDYLLLLINITYIKKYSYLI